MFPHSNHAPRAEVFLKKRKQKEKEREASGKVTKSRTSDRMTQTFFVKRRADLGYQATAQSSRAK
jgi:hypothetical protein